MTGAVVAVDGGLACEAGNRSASGDCRHPGDGSARGHPVARRCRPDSASSWTGHQQLSDGVAVRRIARPRAAADGRREAALAELREGPARSAPARQLARRLTDAGLAHPVPPDAAGLGEPATADRTARRCRDVTVIIPVRDRAGDAGPLPPRCRAAVSRSSSSTTARRIRRRSPRSRPGTARSGFAGDASGGPAAARNTGLAAVRHEPGRVPRQRLRAAARLDRLRWPGTSLIRWSAPSRPASWPPPARPPASLAGRQVRGRPAAAWTWARQPARVRPGAGSRTCRRPRCWCAARRSTAWRSTTPRSRLLVTWPGPAR